MREERGTFVVAGGVGEHVDVEHGRRRPILHEIRVLLDRALEFLRAFARLFAQLHGNAAQGELADSGQEHRNGDEPQPADVHRIEDRPVFALERRMNRKGVKDRAEQTADADSDLCRRQVRAPAPLFDSVAHATMLTRLPRQSPSSQR